MIRILHLLNHDADFESRRSAETLARSLGEEFTVTRQTIGAGGGDFRNAAVAVAMLRRMQDRFDIIHAFGPTALTAAALAVRTPIVFSPLPQIPLRTIRWLRAVMTYRRIDVVCSAATMRRRFVERGVLLERCHLVRPGVDFSRVKRRKDAALRASLGLGDSDQVLLAAGESTRAAAHEQALWAATVLHVADPKYKLLLWGRGPDTGRVRNLMHKLKSLAAARFVEQKLRRPVEFEELLSAADIVLVPASGPVATLPIAMSMAAALPIVATVSYTVSELLEDRHTALMTATGNHREPARRILDLQEDPSLQWSISDMARTEAYEFFAQTRFIQQYRVVYRQAARGERVVVPEQAAGAGLRFHGRA